MRKSPLTEMELEDFQWLASRPGEAALTQAATLPGELSVVTRALRRDLSPARTHLVLEQIELRKRAKSKFWCAEKMLFTRLGLEQASGEIPAAYKASRFGRGDRVFDLCCGLGGDLLSFASRGPSLGIDLDPVAVLFAGHNLRVLGRGDGSVELGRAEDAPLESCRAWHIDPDRRPEGRRTTHLELHEPSAETLERLLARQGNAAIKLAPASEIPATWIDQAEREWIGDGRDCRQQVVWFGDLARHPGRRAATILTRDAPPRTLVGQEQAACAAASAVGRYLCEPHATVLAAGLAPALAAEHGLALLQSSGGYLTADHAIRDRAVACFETLDVLPFDLKRVKEWLRVRRVGRLEVKVRGVKFNPAEILRRLAPSGDESATLLVTLLGEHRIAILAQRATQ